MKTPIAAMILLIPTLALAQCEPAWLFEDAPPPPTAPAAAATLSIPGKLTRVKEAPFKAEDAKKHFNDASSKSPTIDQLLGIWMLEARVEGAGDGKFDRNGLMNKKGEPGVLFFRSDDNPYAGERKNAVAYVENVDYANGNANLDKSYAVTRGELAAGFVETFTAGTKQETRSYVCRLVADDRLLCQVSRSVAYMGVSGQYALDSKGGYTAYYGFSKVRPGK
jgi:hypothetical protein